MNSLYWKMRYYLADEDFSDGWLPGILLFKVSLVLDELMLDSMEC